MTSGDARVDVVVVSHETRPLLEGCLRSIAKASSLVTSVVVVSTLASLVTLSLLMVLL